VRYTKFFNENDVIIVTSLVLRTQPAYVVFCPPLSFTTHQVLNSIVSYEKSEQVQQANLFKR